MDRRTATAAVKQATGMNAAQRGRAGRVRNYTKTYGGGFTTDYTGVVVVGEGYVQTTEVALVGCAANEDVDKVAQVLRDAGGDVVEVNYAGSAVYVRR